MAGGMILHVNLPQGESVNAEDPDACTYGFARVWGWESKREGWKPGIRVEMPAVRDDQATQLWAALS